MPKGILREVTIRHTHLALVISSKTLSYILKEELDPCSLKMLFPVHSGSSENHQTVSVSRKSKQGTLVLFLGFCHKHSAEYTQSYFCFTLPCILLSDLFTPCSILDKDKDG